MKKTYLIPCLVAGLAFVFAINESQAGLYGTNITIPDGKTNGNGVGIAGEDNEAEPGMVQSQAWDLEGFFIKKNTLTMIGGFDFLNGNSGYKSGDIFISTNAVYGLGAGANGSNYSEINGSLGYEYVLDVNWDDNAKNDWEEKDQTFNVLELDDKSLLTSVNVWQNATDPTSNPWRVQAGANLTPSFVTSTYSSFENQSNDSTGFSGWGGDNNHYVVSFDLTSFLISEKLDIEDLYFHFTMGCGNDNLMGHAPVPEPATMLLFGTGLIGLAGVARRRNKKKA